MSGWAQPSTHNSGGCTRCLHRVVPHQQHTCLRDPDTAKISQQPQQLPPQAAHRQRPTQRENKRCGHSECTTTHAVQHSRGETPHPPAAATAPAVADGLMHTPVHSTPHTLVWNAKDPISRAEHRTSGETPLPAPPACKHSYTISARRRTNNTRNASTDPSRSNSVKHCLNV